LRTRSRKSSTKEHNRSRKSVGDRKFDHQRNLRSKNCIWSAREERGSGERKGGKAREAIKEGWIEIRSGRKLRKSQRSRNYHICSRKMDVQCSVLEQEQRSFALRIHGCAHDQQNERK
jgi:hypothetical protein